MLNATPCRRLLGGRSSAGATFVCIHRSIDTTARRFRIPPPTGASVPPTYSIETGGSCGITHFKTIVDGRDDISERTTPDPWRSLQMTGPIFRRSIFRPLQENALHFLTSYQPTFSITNTPCWHADCSIADNACYFERFYERRLRSESPQRTDKSIRYRTLESTRKPRGFSAYVSCGWGSHDNTIPSERLRFRSQPNQHRPAQIQCGDGIPRRRQPLLARLVAP